MKTQLQFLAFIGALSLASCGSSEQANTASNEAGAEPAQVVGQSAVQDSVSSANVVQIAVGSKDHTTLVAAVKAGGLVDVLSNAGPFTVFAPINAAFDKLPAGTVESLLTPEKKDALINILEYHVFVGVLSAESFQDGQSFGQVNGGNIKITMQDGKPIINGKAHILASIPASNGIIHVIDEVLLPVQ